jgi:hypothetical protein
MVQKRPWTVDEKAAIKKHFAKNILLGKLPGKRDIENCLKIEKALRNRNWTNVKDHIRNQIIKE